MAYHYNGNFDAALEIINKYLANKKLSKPQIRVAEKLKEYCQKGEKLTPPADEGKMDDYIKLDLTKDE